MKRNDFPMKTPAAGHRGAARLDGGGGRSPGESSRGGSENSSENGGGRGAEGAAGGATIRELLSFRLHVVANLLSRGAALRYKREFGVSLMEWRTLALLGGGAPMSLNELAKLAGLDKSQMSRVVAGLTARSLILRAVDESDARGVQLSLSAAGRKIYAGLIEAANQRNDAFLAALNQDEQRMLVSVFDKLAGAAREFIHAEHAAGKAAAGRAGAAAVRAGTAAVRAGTATVRAGTAAERVGGAFKRMGGAIKNTQVRAKAGAAGKSTGGTRTGGSRTDSTSAGSGKTRRSGS